MEYLDHELTSLLLQIVPGLIKCVTVIIVICAVHPSLVLLLALLIIPVIMLVKYGFTAYSETTLMERSLSSDINDQFFLFINFSGKTKFMETKFINNLYRSTNAMFSRMVVQRWITLRLDFLLVLFVSLTATFCIAMRKNAN